MGAASANEWLPSERLATITSHGVAHACCAAVQPNSHYATGKLGLELDESDMAFCLRSRLLQRHHAFAKPQGFQRERGCLWTLLQRAITTMIELEVTEAVIHAFTLT